MANKHRGYCHLKTEPADGLSDRVVVGELIGEGFKAANAAEGLFSKCNGRSEAGMREPELQTDQNARQKMFIDRGRGQAGPNAANRKPPVEARHKPHTGRCERRDHHAEIVALDPDVAVRQHD